MPVPQKLITDRLNSNVDTLLKTGQKQVRTIFSAEIFSPFQGSGASGDASPFLKSLFPQIRLAAMLERSLNTALGWGWDKIAGDIAKATHGNAEVGHFVTGDIPATTSAQIDAICIGYTSGTGHISPDTKSELGQLIPGVTSVGAKETIREKDDVFYISNSGIETHLEIKTPKPNYDQMRAAKRRILRLHCVSHPKVIHAKVGMPYNPYGYFGDYGWPTTKYFADFECDLLVGKEFWNFVGDSDTTYDELLQCFLEVAESRHDDLVELLEGSVS